MVMFHASASADGQAGRRGARADDGRLQAARLVDHLAADAPAAQQDPPGGGFTSLQGGAAELVQAVVPADIFDLQQELVAGGKHAVWMPRARL